MAKGAASCPRCGAPALSSGGGGRPERFERALSVEWPAHAAPAPERPSGRPTGPLGRPREPSLVVVLAVLTLGLSALAWVWRASREVDAYWTRPGRAFAAVRGGVILIALGWIAMVASIPLLAGTSSFGVFAALLMGGASVAFGGTVSVWLGFWRTWSAIAEDERRRGRPDPIEPGLMLLFALLPVANLVTFFVALHRGQRHLNEMWAAAALERARE